MAAQPRPDPYPTFSFIIELDGTILGGFSEVSGLGTETRPVDFRQGMPAPTRRLPGLHKSGTLTLKRGVTERSTLYEWQTGGTIRRRSAIIVLLDASRSPVMRWQVVNAWIHKIVGSDRNAAATDVAIETLELNHEGLTTEKLSGPGRD